jgi:hypothetical protein
MRLRIIHAHLRGVVVAVALAGVFAPVMADHGPTPISITPEMLASAADAGFEAPPEKAGKGSKIASVLLEIAELARLRGAWREVAEQRGILTEGDSVLLELRLNGNAARAAVWYLENLGVEIRHHNVPSLIEAWIPVTAIEASAEHADVLLVRPARLVRTTAGSVTSEGVSALNVNTGAVDYDYHDLGADGAGVTIANIDAGYLGYAALQTSGDWPLSTELRRFEVDGGPVVDCDVSTCSNYEASQHGAATMELVYDVAPGSDYLTYRTTTVGDWYAALIDAADRGADIVTVSLSAPLDNVGDGGTCPPIWPAPCGTIAEAAAYARSLGTLVVNSAGNNRTEHWGGTYLGGRWLQWVSGERYNLGSPGGGLVYCYPNGWSFEVSMFWDDWTDPVDHDYDLYLYERVDNQWTIRASSVFAQDGTPGQTPQEYIGYTVTNAQSGYGCPAGTGAFALRVYRYGAATARNIQVFANDFLDLEFQVPERSLGFPADSPDVYAVGAVDVAAPGTLMDYSSEGPVLGPGGTLDPPSPTNPKPDGVSVSGVSTVSYGVSGFGGTSSSAPHTAGIAAILTQIRNDKYASPPAVNNTDGIHDLLSTFALEDPSFPAVFDTTYGHGLVKLRFCDQSVNVSNGEWIMLGLPCTRRAASSVTEVLGDDLDLVSTNWEVWDYDASIPGYRQLTETDQMVPGVGYWLYYEDDATVDIQGLVQDRSEAFSFMLSGEASTFGRANLLGHPFEFDVDWPDATVVYDGSEHSLADAIADGAMRNLMWTPYTAAGYVEHDATLGEGTFTSFDGYFVKAFQDVELRVPTSLAAAPTDGTGWGGQPAGWTVRLQATMHGVTANARLGQLPDSEQGWDLHDAEHMPSFEDFQLAVVMPHPEWGEYAGDYVRDYRNQQWSDSWTFEVRSNLGGTMELRLQGPRRVMRASVLVDLETGEPVPPSTLSPGVYRFDMPAGARKFEWRLR